ncbi:MAG: cyclase family protein [Prevotella sp.]|nr:cyclase family protein [Prevotella sp.]
MKKIDISLLVTPKMVTDAQDNEKKALTGHIGTHFDVMNKKFPLDYTELRGIVFDISAQGQGETTSADIDLSLVGEGMFVAFHSGFIEQVGYGGAIYFKEHPTLSMELIEELLRRHVSIIGIDFAGVRRGHEHTPTDQLCADHGTFIIENLCHLAEVLEGHPHALFHAHTYPMNFSDMTGLPCRVTADV